MHFRANDKISDFSKQKLFLRHFFETPTIHRLRLLNHSRVVDFFDCLFAVMKHSPESIAENGLWTKKWPLSLTWSIKSSTVSSCLSGSTFKVGQVELESESSFAMKGISSFRFSRNSSSSWSLTRVQTQVFKFHSCTIEPITLTLEIVRSKSWSWVPHNHAVCFCERCSNRLEKFLTLFGIIHFVHNTLEELSSSFKTFEGLKMTSCYQHQNLHQTCPKSSSKSQSLIVKTSRWKGQVAISFWSWSIFPYEANSRKCSRSDHGITKVSKVTKNSSATPNQNELNFHGYCKVGQRTTWAKWQKRQPTQINQHPWKKYPFKVFLSCSLYLYLRNHKTIPEYQEQWAQLFHGADVRTRTLRPKRQYHQSTVLSALRIRIRLIFPIQAILHLSCVRVKIIRYNDTWSASILLIGQEVNWSVAASYCLTLAGCISIANLWETTFQFEKPQQLKRLLFCDPWTPQAELPTLQHEK